MNPLIALAFVLCSSPSTATTDRSPNFVIIFTDDQGYEDIGCFGSKQIRTPRLDQMAKEGMKLTSFYAQPICGPSRAALMTGCHPLRVAERGNIKNVHPVLHSKEITVAEVLKAKGYATGCFGKWDLAKHSQRGFHPDLFPAHQGFDYFFGTPTSNDSIVDLYRNEQPIEKNANMATLTERYTDEAIKFIRQHKEELFFVYIPHTMPHTRLDASARFKNRSKRGLYGDVIEEIDYNAGRILDALQEMNLADNTYVLYTSDNGPWMIRNKNLADGSLLGDHGGSAGPLRSGKVSTWEGGQRVPAIVWAPGRVPAGTVCDKLASTVDVLPTFAALASADAPKDRVIDGEDIRHLFHGHFDEANPAKTYYYYLYTHLQAVRQGKWKLHLPRPKEPKWLRQFAVNRHIAAVDRVGFETPFLVDLDADLGETTNVAQKHPDVVRRLLAVADAARDDIGDYNRVGKNMRFFDPLVQRPTSPPLPTKRRRLPAKREPSSKPAPTLDAQSKIPGDRPNVLFISVDDLNDWIGCLAGHPGAKTPNLDRLAARGVLFESAHCPAPICNPSRAALMTGILPSRSGIYANQPFFRDSPVLKDALTIPQYFKQHGYHTMRGGKIFHHFAPTDPVSWHTAFPSLTSHMPPSSVPDGVNADNFRAHKWRTGPLNIKDEEMDDGKVATWAICQLNRKQDRPFFLAVGFYHPHLPWFAPQKYFDMHPLNSIVLPKVKQDDLDDIPTIARTYQTNNGHRTHKRIVAADEWHKKVQAYQASISFVDSQIGRVIDALDDSPHRNNTYIVLWSDHGWHLGEKLRWTKFSLWEESARCVMMMAGPKPITTGGRSPRPVGLIDIYPTLVELCDLPAKDNLDGQSLVPLLRDPERQWERPALTTHGRNNHTLRTEQWRYTRWRTGEEELYDHRNDPMEWTNLANIPRHASLKAELAKWFPTENVAPTPNRPNRPNKHDKLRKP